MIIKNRDVFRARAKQFACPKTGARAPIVCPGRPEQNRYLTFGAIPILSGQLSESSQRAL